MTEFKAEFEPVGEYQPSMLESLFGYSQLGRMEARNGLVYVSQGSSTLGYRYLAHTSVLVNGRITVLDTAVPGPLRVIGHFAAPGVQMAVPLPDGRAIVGGSKLWLVGPPPKHGG